jgi:hypothetical protein
MACILFLSENAGLASILEVDEYVLKSVCISPEFPYSFWGFAKEFSNSLLTSNQKEWKVEFSSHTP